MHRRAALAGLAALATTPARAAEPQLLAEIDGPWLIEGIAGDARRLYLGSIAKRCILTLQHGRTKVLEVGPMWGVFGLAIVGARLWAATANLAVPGQTELVGIDLSRRRIFAHHGPPSGLDGALFGDVALGPAGQMFVSDSKGAVLRFNQQEQRLDVLVARGKLRSPQGMVVDRDSLIVADYSSGLHRVDLATGSLSAIDGGGIRGIDGLVRHGPDLIAIQNGGPIPGVIRIPLARPSDAQVLQAGGVLIDSTLGAVIGGRLIMIGRSQWGEASEHGEVRAGAGPTRIVSLALPA